MSTDTKTDPNAEFDAYLNKLAETPEGQVRIEQVGTALLKLEPFLASDATRPQAEAELQKWADGDDGLRKRIAAHWLDRAKATIAAPGAGGGAAAAGAVADPGGAGDGKKAVHPAIQRLRNVAMRRRAAA